MARKPIQFNWRRHWKKKVEPYLHKPPVKGALEVGMRLLNPQWRDGDAPYELGRISMWPTRIVKGKLSWYQPHGRCHWIVFFSFVIGMLNYPELRWDIMAGDLHTVAVGFNGDGDPEVVMDILLYDMLTAQESIQLTQKTIEGVPHGNWNECYKIFIELWTRGMHPTQAAG